MKRFLVILTSIMFLIIGVTNYYSYKTESYQSLIDPSEDYTYKFKIPDDNLNNDSRHLKGLKKIAKNNEVNIIRTISYYDNEKEKSYTESYLFLTTDTQLFEKINISKGHSLNIDDMNYKNRFMSTNKTNSSNQVGTIADFGGGSNYTIYVMENMISNYKYSGNYRLEAKSDEQYEQFIADYVEYINNYYDEVFDEKNSVEFSPEIYIDMADNVRIEEDNSNIILIIAFFIVIMFLTFVFYIISRTKEISVMKLNGYTTMSICSKIFIEFFTKIFLVSNLLTIPFMFFIKNNRYEFITRVYLTNFIIYVILTILLTFLCFLYANHIEIVSGVRGKKPITIITIINTIFKVAISTVILVVAVNLVTQLNQVHHKKATIKDWSKSISYGVFNPVMVGDDKEAYRAGEDPLYVPAYNLYPYLNREFNAIYINSDIYEQSNLDNNAQNDYIKYITVNPNYLKEYPVLDTEGNKIDINENEDETIYLVPSQYKDKEKYNLDFFSPFREQLYELHRDLYNQKDKAKSKEIKFIYTKPNQEIFSFNPEVMPDNNNMIIDPIIHVITEANALVPDTFYVSSGNMTLFVKLHENNPKLTYEKLLPELKKYELDDNFPYLVQPNEVILEDINELQKELSVMIGILIFLIILLIMVLIQNIYLQFERNKFEYFLKKSLGKTFIEKYKKILLLLIFTNLLEFIVGLIVLGLVNRFIIIFTIKIIIEIALAVLLIVYFERKNVIQVLKEGV